MRMGRVGKLATAFFSKSIDPIVTSIGSKDLRKPPTFALSLRSLVYEQ